MSSLIKGPLDGAAAVRELSSERIEGFTFKDDGGQLQARGIVGATTADVENDGDRGPRASTDQALAPKRQKPFPMPGTVWRWLGHPDFDPKPSAPKRVESLRWFRGRVEAMFVGGESCAGVEHLMGSDAWEHYPETEPVRPSRDPLASIDAAAQGQHARAMVDLVAASLGLHVDEVRVLVWIARRLPREKLRAACEAATATGWCGTNDDKNPAVRTEVDGARAATLAAVRLIEPLIGAARTARRGRDEVLRDEVARRMGGGE